ncbi:MAG: glycoside hydrolase family 95 protein [Candidatus Cyclobacteriaceae bacterium M3_2C_046]
MHLFIIKPPVGSTAFSKNRYLAIFFLGLFFVGCQNKKPIPNETLWYNYPATYWNSQALHLGNSYFGASFFGGIETETFSLSEKSMWEGQPARGNWEKAGVNPRALPSLPAIRTAVVQGKTQLADSLITHNFFGDWDYYGHFTSIGDFKINFQHKAGKPEDYIRSLDLANALGSVSYRIGDINYHREYFCSYPDQVLAIKITAGKPAQINLSLVMNIMQDSSRKTVQGNMLSVRGYINKNKRPFQVMVEVRPKGGEIGVQRGHLMVKGSDEVVLLLTTATNYQMEYPDYRGEDPEIRTRAVLEKISQTSYATMKQKHLQDYHRLYQSVKFKIDGDPDLEALPTNQRFQKLRQGSMDPGYKELAFNLGRYMIISASRPNSLPANLQGVWNTFKVAPWAGNYQSNINIQEIYWSCGPTNLDECQQPYIDWIENLAISGREVAKRVYGTGGWVSHTTGNIWGHAAPIGDHPWGMYPLGAAWHCQHVWDHFAFTLDTLYLRQQAYPLLKDASVFWLQNLIPFQSYLITAPSVSAEHGAMMTDSGLNPAFHDQKSDRYHYSLPGIYQDMQMIRDLFANTAKAADMIGDYNFADSLRQTSKRLLPAKIGKYGQLQEWYQDIDHPEGHHRHIGHLYAVAPGNQISPFTTPELAQAAKVSLNLRGDGRYPEQELASGGNWSRAHRMWCWIRLLDGNRANKILSQILTEQGFENVLTHQHADYHWNRPDLYQEDGLFLHFQLDASASIPGAITEMLLQSHLDELHLLPALPDEFANGSISGIKARGGYRVDLLWENHQLKKAVIYSKIRQKPVIRVKGRLINPDKESNIEIVFI